MDLNIKIENNKFSLSLYDKRDTFPFSIVRMPYLSSNIPSKMFYATLGAEVLRIGRTSTVLNSFVSSSQRIIKRMQKQGGRSSAIVKCLQKTYGRNFEVFREFANTCQEFLDLIFPQ